jgi:uncharacterized membrane protein
MESRAKLLGHAVHPILIVFPLGLLPVAVIADVIALFTKNNFWFQMSFYLIAAGIIGGLLASVFGLVDYLAIPAETRAKRIGFLHGVGNVIVLGRLHLLLIDYLNYRRLDAFYRRLPFLSCQNCPQQLFSHFPTSRKP